MCHSLLVSLTEGVYFSGVIFCVTKIYIINIFDRSKSLFIDLGFQFGSSFVSFSNWVVPEKSIGVVLALRGMRIVSEQKYDIS